jgi:hypothetical protein
MGFRKIYRNKWKCLFASFSNHLFFFKFLKYNRKYIYKIHLNIPPIFKIYLNLSSSFGHELISREETSICKCFVCLCFVWLQTSVCLSTYPSDQPEKQNLMDIKSISKLKKIPKPFN